MTRPIVEWSMRFRFMVLGVAAVVLLLGSQQVADIPVDVMPEFSPPYVEIQTEALGLSAEEVEQLITVPMEADLLHGVAFLDEISSVSVPGLSSIVLTFDPGTEIHRARQVVTERMSQAAALPNVSKPPVMIQPLSSASRVLMVGLRSEDVPLIDMSVLARWTVRPRLLGVPGVANVSIWGQRERQLQVQVDPRELADSGVSLQQVVETTGNALWVSPLSYLDASTPGTGGFIDTPNQRLGVRHILPIRGAEDLARVPIEAERGQQEPALVAQASGSEGVAEVAGSALTLGDVATVVEDHQPLIGDAVVEDGPGLLLVIERFPGASSAEVTRGVEAALEDLRAGLAGIQIDTSLYRPATYIDSAISNVGLALLAGIVLAALVILLLGLGWRAALVSLLVLPFSLCAGALVLHWLGASINALSAAGLVLAVTVMVDEIVVGMDALTRRIRAARAGGDDRPVAALIVDATLEHRGALAYATAIILVALLPAFFVAGPAGVFLSPVAGAYALAVLVAALVALTLVPVLASFMLPDRLADGRPSWLARALEPRYGSLLAGALRRAAPVLGVALGASVFVVMLTGVAFARQSESSLLPAFRERDLLVRWDGASGTSRSEMARIVSRATSELRGLEGVRNVGAHFGRAITSDQVTGIAAGEIWVNIDPAADYDRTVSAIEEVVSGYPGLERSVVSYQSERADEILAGPATDITVRVYGQDMDVLRAKAAEVQEAVSAVDGVAATSIPEAQLEPGIEIEVDLAAAERYGVKAGDVRRAAAALLSGLEVGSLFEEQKVFEVVVWGKPDIRSDLSSIRDLGIETPAGEIIRLDEVADVRVAAAPSQIDRESVFRYVDVGVDVAGGDTGAVLAGVAGAIKTIDFPLEYHAEVLGHTAEAQAAFLRGLVVLAGVLVAALLLLQAAFGSWRLALLVLLALPSAVIGGVVGAVLVGGSVTIGMVVGFFAVLAIAVRHAVTLIGQVQRLERDEARATVPRVELILGVARERVAPVITAAAAAAAALVPFIALGDVAGLEVMRPMAAVIVGGLISATLFSLLAVPTVCLIAGPSPAPDETAELVQHPMLETA